MADSSAEPHLRMELLSQARFLAAARGMVGNLAQRLGFPEQQCSHIGLAIDEALCNIINHGYERRPDGRIWISIWIIDGERPGLQIVVEDRAKQVEPRTIKSRELDDIRPGGLGVHIIREVMDDVKYEKRPEGGMRLTMVKRMTASAEEACCESSGESPTPGSQAGNEGST